METDISHKDIILSLKERKKNLKKVKRMWPHKRGKVVEE